MTQGDFLQKFVSQFSETDPSTITIDTNFREIDEWSSLTALEIIAMVDEEYGVTLSGDDLRNSNKVSDIYDVIKSKMSGNV